MRNYLRVLDDATYAKLIPSRHSMFPYENMLLGACLDNLNLVMEDYGYLIRRCGPLASRTKQSLEINEEDHGKAIMVFTVVTVIFLPLSFATSYLGMNTVDIRDMDQKQSLFWIIAIPLTVVTVGACLVVGYYGEYIRDMVVSLCRRAIGKQGTNNEGGIGLGRRKRPLNALGSSSSTTLESSAFANETEFIKPRAVVEYDTVAHSSPGWVNADDAWYTPPVYESSTQRPPQYSAIRRPRVTSYAEHIPVAAAPPYETQHSYLRTGRDNTDVHYDNEYVEGRRLRGNYHYNDWGSLDDELQTGGPRRRVYTSSRPGRSEVHIRQEPEITIRRAQTRAEYDRPDDHDASRYTWGKKRPDRSHRHRYPRSEVR